MWDFDDAARLRKEPQWRGRGHIRRDLKIVPVFSPLVYGMG